MAVGFDFSIGWRSKVPNRGATTTGLARHRRSGKRGRKGLRGETATLGKSYPLLADQSGQN